MQFLRIRNAGEIDPLALTLLGASTKENGQSIGFFGSGNKYALATILRRGLTFRIFSGEREIAVEVRNETFRGESFGVIWLDGKATSITTRTGPKWEVRDAIRELWSNALDEGEEEIEMGEFDLRGTHGVTTLFIEASPEVVDMWTGWEQYFLPKNAKQLYHNDYGRILTMPLSGFYRRGVWICEDRKFETKFTYDFTAFDLPESRKVDSNATVHYVAYVLETCPNVGLFASLITDLPREHGEWKALSRYMSSPAKEAIKKAFLLKYDFVGNARNQGQFAAGKHKVLWIEPGCVLGVLLDAGIPSIETHMKFDEAFTCKPWPIGAKQILDRELALLTANGIDLRPFQMQYVEFREANRIAQADMKNGRCLLCARAFEDNGRALRKALIEEWTHLAHNVLDHTVAQQHVYLDTIVRLLK